MSRDVKTKLGYQGNFKETTLQIPADEPAPWTPQDSFQIVSKDVTRLDGFAKVTGQAKYATDIRLPGMLHARILRSPHPAATIASINTKKAAKLPGVKAVEVLSSRELRYVGQPIAAVAATSAHIAEDAIRLIEVSYKTKPFVVDLEASMKPAAPAVYKASSDKKKSPNIRVSRRSTANPPDVDAQLKAAHKQVSGTFRTQVQTHTCLEPHAFVAAWKGNKLTVWASTQGTFSVRNELAQVFNLSASDVHVITEYMGGGFGSKFGAGTEGILAAKLAKAAKAPVKLIPTRKGEQLANGNRPDSLQTLSLGLNKDGSLAAMKHRSYGTGGVSGGAGTSAPFSRIYTCAHRSAQDFDVFTHAGPARAFRAPGHPQGVFSLESMIDIAAEAAGLDPLAMRLKNDSSEVRRAQLQLGAKRIGWSRRNKTPGKTKGPRKRGIGMASGLWYNTGRPQSQIQLSIHQDGTVEVRSGVQDIGTGIRTLIGQITAEELGLPLKAITVKIGHTEYPLAPGSGGSTTTPTVTPAVRAAAYQAKQKLFETARRLLKLPKDAALQAKGGNISKVGDASKSLPFKKVARALPVNPLSVQSTRSHDYQSYSRFVAGAQFADVEVDVQTGQVRVLKVVAVQDCGLAINRLTTRSQINGGVIQGLSYALFEDRILDQHTGRMVNPNLEQYKIAGALDMPEIDAVIFDVSNGANCTGTVGIGEPATIPTSAAIANAVYNAIGARVYELPITPARVLAALAKAKG